MASEAVVWLSASSILKRMGTPASVLECVRRSVKRVVRGAMSWVSPD
jgi:hypothetical protein